MNPSDQDKRREEIISKIRKLSRMTIENGCSEAEALFAAAKLAELMAEYNVNADELTVRADASGCLIDEFINPGSYNNLTSVAGAIGKLFGCRQWYERRTEENPFDDSLPRVEVSAIRFFGPKSDVAACLALTAIVFCATTTEARNFAKTLTGKQRERRSLTEDFRIGMSVRLAGRITELRRQREGMRPTGTALISLKNQLVEDEWAKQNIRLRHTRSPMAHNAAAYGAGARAADRVDLGGGNRVPSSTSRLTSN